MLDTDDAGEKLKARDRNLVRKFSFLLLISLPFTSVQASSKDQNNRLLELLECRGPADPEWRPLAAQLAIQGVPFEDDVTEICFKPDNWKFNGLHITGICGRGLPRTPHVTDYVTIFVNNSVTQTIEWIGHNVGSTRSEVIGFKKGASITCWPKG